MLGGKHPTCRPGILPSVVARTFAGSHWSGLVEAHGAKCGGPVHGGKHAKGLLGHGDYTKEHGVGDVLGGCDSLSGGCEVCRWKHLGVRVDVRADRRGVRVPRMSARPVVLRQFPARLSIVLYWSVLVAASGLGWSAAEGDLPQRIPDSPFREAVAIAAHNFVAVCVLVVASLASGGVGGLFFFAVNGYAFGQMLGMAPPEKTPWVLVYAPVELWAFTAAAVASARLSWAVARWLGDGTSFADAARRVAISLVLIVVLLVVAAILEAIAIRGAWGIA